MSTLTPMEEVTPGHRVECTPEGFLPPGWMIPGAYGRLNRTLEQVWNCEAQLWWNVCAPDGSACSLNPALHNVTEHVDGTITVSPSIVTPTWHGWLQCGVWRSV
jgi:hypothetical protein